MSPTPDPAKASATPSSSPSGELGSILLLTAAWVGMATLVDPRGEFSLNDDWAYAFRSRPSSSGARSASRSGSR